MSTVSVHYSFRTSSVLTLFCWLFCLAEDRRTMRSKYLGQLFKSVLLLKIVWNWAHSLEDRAKICWEFFFTLLLIVRCVHVSQSLSLIQLFATPWAPLSLELSGQEDWSGLPFPPPVYCVLGEGNGTPLQHSCLENPRDRGAWGTAVYEVAQSWTRVKRLSSSSSSRVIFWYIEKYWVMVF